MRKIIRTSQSTGLKCGYYPKLIDAIGDNLIKIDIKLVCSKFAHKGIPVHPKSVEYSRITVDRSTFNR